MSENRSNRRQFLGQLGLMGAGAMLGSCAVTAAPNTPNLDMDVLNFALNLEYLEAEFYQWAAFGKGLSAADSGGGPASVGGKKVNFTDDRVRQYAEEIAQDELAHVRALRATIIAHKGTPVARPKIDIGAAFTAAANAASAGGITNFDAYANDLTFMHAAFVFEDVGVTAYSGAAPLLTDKGILGAAAGILAVEAYHAGTVRSYLYSRKDEMAFGLKVEQIVAAISNLRDKADGENEDKDQGITAAGKANIVPTDANGIAFARTTAEVLSIVYLGGAGKGGFFPEGLNGNIK